MVNTFIDQLKSTKFNANASHRATVMYVYMLPSIARKSSLWTSPNRGKDLFLFSFVFELKIYYCGYIVNLCCDI